MENPAGEAAVKLSPLRQYFGEDIVGQVRSAALGYQGKDARMKHIGGGNGQIRCPRCANRQRQ